MDKYIDDFCEKHFAEFERLGQKNVTDRSFRLPCIKPSFYKWLLSFIGIVAILLSKFVSSTSCGCNMIMSSVRDIGIGILASAFVVDWFEKRDCAVDGYKKMLNIIRSRMNSIRRAEVAAREYRMNEDASGGLQLLQYTAQNAWEFASYLDDRIGSSLGLDIVAGIVVQRSIESDGSSEDECKQFTNATRTISELLARMSAVSRRLEILARK